MATISLPTPLRPYADKQSEIQVQGQTVGEALSDLTSKFPKLKQHLFAEDGNLRSFVNVYLNDEDMLLEKGATSVAETDALASSRQSPEAARDMTGLSREEIQRYSRHLILEEVGMKGQEKLKDSAVLCVGTGGLGSPLLLYLAAAGVGRIGIVDFDVVDESNLQRQIIHGTSTVGHKKVLSAKERILTSIHYQGRYYEEALTSDNALRLFGPYDVIVGRHGQFPNPLSGQRCVVYPEPNVYGSIFKFEGQCTVFNYEDGPNYRDFTEPPPPGRCHLRGRRSPRISTSQASTSDRDHQGLLGRRSPGGS